LRVAFLTRDYPPSVGGIATHASSLAGALRRLGVDVNIFSGRTDTNTLFLPLTHSFDGFDLVHVQSSPYAPFVNGAPFIVTVHAPVRTEWRHYSWLSKVESPVAILTEKVTFRRASAILSVSETTTSSLVKGYGLSKDRITLIGNGVDFERFSRGNRGSRERGLILMVSRLEPRKNMEAALRALSRLPRGSYSAKVVGDGSQRRGLERLAKSLGVEVEFLGRVSDDALPALYQEAGIFLTTSYSEGFGLSLLEAMSAGCAVVASDIQPHRDLVEDGRNGMIYSSPPDLQRVLGILLSNADAAERMGRAGIAMAKRFSWDAVGQRVLEVYERCLFREEERHRRWVPRW
jgi:glycosyltransferase involved in cell wall biosynthesis